MACYKNAQLSRCQETFTGLPEALWGKRGFGSFMKRQENVHENLSTWNCRKASRMRIKVRLPSVWRTDEYLADNYNPLKANKSTIMLFQHEVNHADADADSFLLIGCLLMRHPIYSPNPNNSLRLKGPEVRPRITSITHPKWTLNKLIWLLIYLGWASVSYQFICLMNVTSLYCSIEERATPMSLLQQLAAVGMRLKWYNFLMFLYSLRKKKY